MAAQFVNVAGGAAVSSAVALDWAGAFAVLVSSHAQRDVSVEFTTQSGGGGEWHRHTNAAGNNYVISSATALPGVGFVEHAVTPFLRIRFGGSGAASTTSCAIVPVR